MEILRIAFIGVAGVVCALIFKQWKSEYAQYISLATAIIIFAYITSKIKVITDILNSFQDYVSIKGEYLMLLMKMTGVTYVSEFASSICRDCGHQAVASQIEIFAKIALLSLSLPVVLSLLETISRL